MTDKSTITAKRLREVLDYCPDTGIFTWKVRLTYNRDVGRTAGNKHKREGYFFIGIDGGLYAAHRLAWLYVTGKWPKEQLDHINAQRDDNRFSNLREASHAENHHNRPRQKNNTSGYKGVTWDKEFKRWAATICLNGKNKRLGRYKNIEDAAKAYADAAKRHFGDFARW